MKEKNTYDDARIRQYRVERFKRTIILSLFILILIPIILSIFLMLKVYSLQKQIDEIAKAKFDQKNISVSADHTDEYTLKDGVYAKELDIKETTLPKESASFSDKEEIIQEEIDDKEERRKVYLTFDDGPSSSTPEILDILQEYGVKATFFVVGQEDEESKELYRRIVEEGHTLAMHTYSHQYSIIYESVESFAEDTTKLQDYLYEVTGVKTNLFRFPGGSSNLVSNIGMEGFIQYLNEKEIIYFDWNVSSGDATNRIRSAGILVDNVMQDVVRHKNSIVLMHDANNKKNTVEALPIIIEKLLEMDVDIEALDENVKPIQHIGADEIN